MRQDHLAVLHSRPEKIKFWRDLGAGRQARDKGLRRAWEKGWLHAAGNRIVRRIHHSRDHDVFRLDIRNVHWRDRREAAFLATISRSAFAESLSEESQVRTFRAAIAFYT